MVLADHVTETLKTPTVICPSFENSQLYAWIEARGSPLITGSHNADFPQSLSLLRRLGSLGRDNAHINKVTFTVGIIVYLMK